MEFVLHLFLGLAMAFVGLLPPGMLNMTAVRTTINDGLPAAKSFSFGAAIVVFFQAGLALFFANYLNENPQIIQNLKWAGVVVFFILALFFFSLAQKRFKGEGKKTSRSPFMAGFFMSSINMLGIPFYLAWSTILAGKGLLIFQSLHILLFIVGAAIGAYLLFYLYARMAKVIQQKSAFLARNINYFLSVLFVFLGSSVLYNLLSS